MENLLELFRKARLERLWFGIRVPIMQTASPHNAAPGIAQPTHRICAFSPGTIEHAPASSYAVLLPEHLLQRQSQQKACHAAPDSHGSNSGRFW